MNKEANSRLETRESTANANLRPSQERVPGPPKAESQEEIDEVSVSSSEEEKEQVRMMRTDEEPSQKGAELPTSRLASELQVRFPEVVVWENIQRSNWVCGVCLDSREDQESLLVRCDLCFAVVHDQCYSSLDIYESENEQFWFC